MIKCYPDAYFTVRPLSSEVAGHFFLEVDLGTMTYFRFKGKLEAYKRFRESGASFTHYGTKNFRVLIVTTTLTRMRGIKRTIEAVGGSKFFWVTTTDRLDLWQTKTFLDQIWEVAGDNDKHVLFTTQTA